MSRFVRPVSTWACLSGGWLTRQSSYRHVYGQPSKVHYENAKISGSAWDTNLVTVGGVSCAEVYPRRSGVPSGAKCQSNLLRCLTGVPLVGCQAPNAPRLCADSRNTSPSTGRSRAGARLASSPSSRRTRSPNLPASPPSSPTFSPSRAGTRALCESCRHNVKLIPALTRRGRRSTITWSSRRARMGRVSASRSRLECRRIESSLRISCGHRASTLLAYCWRAPPLCHTEDSLAHRSFR